jgi:hypothetical protein
MGTMYVHLSLKFYFDHFNQKRMFPLNSGNEIKVMTLFLMFLISKIP